jgi:hypothetical protein
VDFLFFFASDALERAFMVSVGFHAWGPINVGARGGSATFPPMSGDLPVVLAAAPVARTAPVTPNRFRGTNTVVGVDSSGIASVGKSDGAADPATF